MPSQPEHDASKRDTFLEDWRGAKEFWQRVHRKMDYNYLMYRSILTYNKIYGEKYLESFGVQVFVPRTFLTIESLSASENVQKVEFIVRPNNHQSRKLTKYCQKLDNIEWRRSGTDVQSRDALKDSRIFGNGYLFSAYIEDKGTFHFPKTAKEEEAGPQDPEDGVPDEDANALVTEKKESNLPLAKQIEWEEREIERYRGMKGTCENPYYVFTDPNATCDDDRRHVYLYRPMPTETAREYVVAQGWITKEEAQEKIHDVTPEYFDSIRETIDWMYNLPIYTGYNRGDHQDPASSFVSRPVERRKTGMTVILERWSPDGFEARLGENEVLISTYNPYPHKRIPITTYFDYKIPHEFVAMGEPEVMRHQQIEENKLHNLILQVAMMGAGQRYAVDTTLLKDESDLYWSDPFKPLRLKAGLGTRVSDAIAPLPQPDVKSSPFELIKMVIDIGQKTTAANDFIVSSSDAGTETATESNNLVAATTNRIRYRIITVEESVKNVINLWHPCYFVFYSDEMDLRLTGKDVFVRYIPYNRDEANEDEAMIAKVNAELGVEGMTLTEAYKYAGYDDVIFLSDIHGEFDADVSISDPQRDEQRFVAMFQSIIQIADQVNKIAKQTGADEEIDVFKMAKDMFMNITSIGNTDEYIRKVQAPPQAAMAPVLPEGQEPQAMGMTPDLMGAPMPEATVPNSPIMPNIS